MGWLQISNLVICILFLTFYSYQILYIFISLFRRPKTFPDAPKDKRYAVLISARNERGVIGFLLDSIAGQDYPSELVRAFVIADNCTDDTAEVARAHGATVYERSDPVHVGKGYALTRLIGCIWEDFGKDAFDGYLVVDADNLLTPNYLTEMNKALSAGYPVLTGYRNIKNYGDSWLASGTGLWFLHENRQLNNVRTLLGTSCAVSGTGFMVSREVLLENEGWKQHLLLEDVEFTADSILAGRKITYVHAAVLYDEQPVRFGQSFRQKLRWAKGYLQILHKYFGKLFRAIFRKGGFSAYDMLMNITPAYLLTLATVLVNVAGIVSAIFVERMEALEILRIIGTFLFGLYWFAFLVGLTTGLCEWKRIRASAGKKIWSFFTFPVYMLSFVPAALAAFFIRPQWKPIEHTRAQGLDAVESSEKSPEKKN